MASDDNEKRVTVTISGNLTGCRATVDSLDLHLAGFNGALSATLRGIAPAEHKLSWSVSGAQGDQYTVSLSGDTEDWSRSFTLLEDGDDGNKHFTIK